MLLILSPAKTFNTNESLMKAMTPLTFQDQTKLLVDLLKSYNSTQLQKWMKMSQTLAEENYERYQKLQSPKSKGYCALDAFLGEAYKGLDAATLDQESRNYLQEHLLILSGLYGALHPEDRIQPYRLEMATKFENWMYKDLYHYWRHILTAYSLALLEKDKNEQVLINLASTEYSKALDLKKINQYYPVITISFKEQVGEDAYKTVGMYAKKARGQMVRYIANHRVKDREQLKRFEGDGYGFNQALSSNEHYVYTRRSK